MAKDLSTENVAVDRSVLVVIVQDSTKRPWFVGPLLVLATAAISSAAAVTKLMDGAAPISKAGWRLQATALLLLPGFLWQWCRQSLMERSQFTQIHTLFLLAVSSLSLSFHFGLWVWSLDYTSLPHSLLLVSMPPIILALYACCKRQPLSTGETMGVALGVLGAVVMAAGSYVENDTEVTLAGDLAAFLSAAAFAVHITAGSHLREWMPLYVYVFPITAGAALFLGFAGIVIEGFLQSSFGRVSGPFSWFKQEFLFPNLFLAIGPGFVGHTGFSAVLRYVSPLLVAMAITLEPVFGSAIAWATNVSPAPGLWTCLGGALLLCGTIWVNLASEKRKHKEMVNTDLNTDSTPPYISRTDDFGTIKDSHTIDKEDGSYLEESLLTPFEQHKEEV
ncbi:hypothetical protein O6H91_17G007000 [Diphasiastrum complanatum]|uniref:Uncharacterized protein n=1 Tax=Diphasiastrum complanatum TaxID=34168 RepID=A0ACC2B3Y5_DIPCM|nr:hypothetical protein O6H91_17G007000 [Diphasiastrum complanatum]